MALQGSHICTFGPTYPTAYARVMAIDANWVTKRALITVVVWMDKTAHDTGKQDLPASLRSYQVNEPNFTTYFGNTVQSLAGVTMLTKAQEYIKTIAEWSTWTEVA